MLCHRPYDDVHLGFAATVQKKDSQRLYVLDGTMARTDSLKWTVILHDFDSAKHATASDDAANTYPDPGHTLLAAYRDSDPTYFDYDVGETLNWSGDTFPNKKQWWQEYRQNYLSNPMFKYRIIIASSSHNYCLV